MNLHSAPGTAARAGVRVVRVPTASPREWEAQLDHHRKALRAYLRRKGFGAEDADDLTQETLVRAYLHLSEFRGASLSAWLYRIAANVAVDHLRKRRPVSVALERVGSLPAEDAADPAEELARDERRKRVLELIRELPECHRRILWLRFYEDCSMAEIGSIVHCSPMAAKLRVFRAMTALRKRCGALGPEGDWLAG